MKTRIYLFFAFLLSTAHLQGALSPSEVFNTFFFLVKTKQTEEAVAFTKKHHACDYLIDNNGNTILHRAMALDNYDDISFIIDFGTKKMPLAMDATNQQGQTMLHCLFHNLNVGNCQCISPILAQCPGIADVQDKWEHTPIQWFWLRMLLACNKPQLGELPLVKKAFESFLLSNDTIVVQKLFIPSFCFLWLVNEPFPERARIDCVEVARILNKHIESTGKQVIIGYWEEESETPFVSCPGPQYDAYVTLAFADKKQS